MKIMMVKMASSSPRFGVKISKTMDESTTQLTLEMMKGASVV